MNLHRLHEAFNGTKFTDNVINQSDEAKRNKIFHDDEVFLEAPKFYTKHIKLRNIIVQNDEKEGISKAGEKGFLNLLLQIDLYNDNNKDSNPYKTTYRKIPILVQTDMMGNIIACDSRNVVNETSVLSAVDEACGPLGGKLDESGDCILNSLSDGENSNFQSSDLGLSKQKMAEVKQLLAKTTPCKKGEVVQGFKVLSSNQGSLEVKLECVKLVATVPSSSGSSSSGSSSSSSSGSSSGPVTCQSSSSQSSSLPGSGHQMKFYSSGNGSGMTRCEPKVGGVAISIIKTLESSDTNALASCPSGSFLSNFWGSPNTSYHCAKFSGGSFTQTGEISRTASTHTGGAGSTSTLSCPSSHPFLGSITGNASKQRGANGPVNIGGRTYYAPNPANYFGETIAYKCRSFKKN